MPIIYTIPCRKRYCRMIHFETGTMIQLCEYVIQSTRQPKWISAVSSTASGNITVLFFYSVIPKIQNTINIYPLFWRHLTCPIQNFGNSSRFECDAIMTKPLWRHGGGSWHHDLFLTTVSNVNVWADFVNDFTQTRLDCGEPMTRKTYINRQIQHIL